MSYELFPQETLSLVEILSALSYALDLTGGQPMGHAQRSCLIGMRLGMDLGLDQDRLSSLYHALLLKDSGCSSNAARMYEIYGSDEIAAKRDGKIVDWSNVLEAAKYAAAHALPTGGLLARAQRMLQIATHREEVAAAVFQSRCDRGAQVALGLGLGQEAAECIRALDEHWDGLGAPARLAGEQIPLLARIACLAQTLEVFVQTFGLDAAYAMLRDRSRRWFDPELVRLAEGFRADTAFWTQLSEAPREALLALDIRASVEIATASRIDAVCDAFAEIVDAKSHFTAEHSTRVCQYAVEIAQAMGFNGVRLTQIRRAALLHDIGKLAVSNAILDKPGKLDAAEWQVIKQHPYYTQQILGQIQGFSRLSEIAAAHHERLDGSGYFRGLSANALDTEMRILAVADVFDALSAARPYRGALPLSEVFAIMDKDANTALDGDCLALLKQRYAERAFVGDEAFRRAA
ncbi:MAG: HD domain-containing protein [Armatimonadota bacterium]|nr:HD domain-containing protein [Armatimonadota bacterium]